jgi:hypothetical protein
MFIASEVHILARHPAESKARFSCTKRNDVVQGLESSCHPYSTRRCVIHIIYFSYKQNSCKITRKIIKEIVTSKELTN